MVEQEKLPIPGWRQKSRLENRKKSCKCGEVERREGKLAETTTTLTAALTNLC